LRFTYSVSGLEKKLIDFVVFLAEGSGWSMRRITWSRDRLAIHIETFLFAGTSALLLALVRLYPDVWFLSFFALVPFLWRTIRANVGSSIISGLILASCYMLVVQPHDAWNDPSAWFFGLSILGSVFWLYGCAVGWVYRRLGRNAILVALIWLPAEYLVSYQTDFTIVPMLVHGSGGFFVRIASLGGLLVLSFSVVLINLLILAAIDKIANVVSSGSAFHEKKIRQRHTDTSPVIEIGCSFLLPESRGPPAAAFTR
jgi:apolipoprotein N-acyltransferase